MECYYQCSICYRKAKNINLVGWFVGSFDHCFCPEDRIKFNKRLEDLTVEVARLKEKLLCPLIHSKMRKQLKKKRKVLMAELKEKIRIFPIRYEVYLSCIQAKYAHKLYNLDR